MPRNADLIKRLLSKLIGYEIAERAGKLRSQYPSIRTPDALIVATALESDCDVFVTNDKNLKKLEVCGLYQINPFVARGPCASQC